jgi:ferredoxin
MNEHKEKAEVIRPEGGPKECIEEAIDTFPISFIHWQEE